MSDWFIDQKEDAYLEGQQVMRISIGGNDESGYYIVYRGNAGKAADLLSKASDRFKEFLTEMGVEV